MIYNKYYILILISIFCELCFGQNQNISDYFIPSEGKNKAFFYTPDSNGKKTSLTREIYYVKNDNAYEITDIKKFKGIVNSIQTCRVEIKNNEIQMTNSTSKSILDTNSKKIYTPPVVILKFPNLDDGVSWVTVNISGDTLKCVAKKKTIFFMDKAISAIQVTRYYSNQDRITEIYVKGIGLWSTFIKSGENDAQTLDEFDKLEYVPEVK